MELNVELNVALQRFGIALLIGLLIGLERESSKESERGLVAGVRTFAIVALMGGACGLFHTSGFDWPIVAGLLSIAVFLTAAYVIGAPERKDLGMTSNFAALLVFLVGAIVVAGEVYLGAALAIVLAVLLTAKPPLHQFAARLHREDIVAALKFGVVSVIILPLLPNRTFGPLDVLNPRLIWLMVVFISGIGFLGYVLIKFLGSSRGIGVTGLLGGIVSSTALTLSFAQRGRDDPRLAAPLSMAIVLASTTMFPRVALAVAVVNAQLLRYLAIPLLVVTAAGLIACGSLYRLSRREHIEQVEFANPFALGPAIQFGLLFGVILLFSKAAQTFAGDAGIYLASLVSGFAGVDPITLSMAGLTSRGDVAQQVGATAILCAALTNTLLKAGMAFSLGPTTMRGLVLRAFGVLLLVSLAVLLALRYAPQWVVLSRPA